MFDMILGPAGQNIWNSQYLGGVRFHHDWSRCVWPAANVAQELSVFDYNIGDQNPASLVNAIVAPAAAIVAEEYDTSLDAEDTVSQDCILTHLGICIERGMPNTAVANDTVQLAASYLAITTRLFFKFAHKDRNNIESMGKLEDYGEGKGPVSATDAAAVGAQAMGNGVPAWSNIRPLPRPLPCTKGQSFIRGTFYPMRRGGLTAGVIQGVTVDIYGVRL